MVTTSPTSWNVEQKTFISGGGNELPCSLTREPDTDPDFPTIWPRCISNIHPNHNHASEPNHCAKKNTQTFTIFHYLSLIPVYSSIIRVISNVTTRMVLHISWLLKLPPHNVFRILLPKKTKLKAEIMWVVSKHRFSFVTLGQNDSISRHDCLILGFTARFEVE